MKSIQEFYEYQHNIVKLQYVRNLLSWELKTKVPKEANDYLIEIKTQYDAKIFKLKTSDEYSNLLERCLNGSEFQKLDCLMQEFIRKQKRKYDLNKKVPVAFYQEYRKLCDLSSVIWLKAKKENNYQLFKPYLEKLVTMTKQYYTYMYPDKNLYDAMLESYERGVTSEIIDPLFDKLKEKLIPLIKKRQAKIQVFDDYNNDYSVSELMDCATYLLNYIGFDFNRGTLGIFDHASTEKMSCDDIRIVFKQEKNPFKFVSTIIHEGGHALFEQNIKKEISMLDNDEVDLYGLHESQSRFFENILGRNINFWLPIYDDIKKKLHLDCSVQEFCEHLNEIKMTPIRINADELTYCLHIIIRYEIEKALFNDEISVDELPSIWNNKVKEYLNIDVTSDKDGLLQDIHWADGCFGYFPSYLLGNIYDGMFLKAIKRDLGNIDSLLKEGNIKKITDYLIYNIYQYGGTYSSSEVIEKICHEPISVDAIVDYFYEKYDV